MRPLFFKLLCALLLPLATSAQTFVVPQPDCLIFFHFTVTGQTSPTAPNAGLDNRTNGCTTWNLSFTSVTLTNATVTLQSAPNTATGVPGAWVTYANQTVINGTNPLSIAATPAAGFAWVVGYNPWVRVLLTIAGGPAAGVVDGAAYGWRIPSAGNSAVATQNVNIVSPLGQATMAASIPVVIASNQSSLTVQGTNFTGTPATLFPVLTGGRDSASNVEAILTNTNGAILPAGQNVGLADAGSNTVTVPASNNGLASAQQIATPYPYRFNGTTWDREFACTNRAVFNLSGAGDTQIIAASGSTVVRICHISLSTTPPEDIKITQGTGVNCATGPADLTGLYKQVTALAFDFGNVGALRSSASQAICINQSLAQATGGVVIYAQY
jgi:hypothetical protein